MYAPLHRPPAHRNASKQASRHHRSNSVSMRLRAAKVSSPAANWIDQNLSAGAVQKEKFLGGSNWSSAYVYTTADGSEYFVKLAMSTPDDSMFRGEALGLQAMYDTGSVQVPKVHHVGMNPDGRGSFIVMEYLHLGGALSQAALGRALAQMHLATPQDPNAAAGKFGFPVDNTIGATPQPNGWMDNWVDFYRERRLKHQLRLAGDTRLSRLGEQLCDNLEVLFEDVAGDITPAVLHGDLWSGNIAAVGGQPAIFDPAVYYGHSEAEFGMSWCAGFTGEFYRAYHEVIPPAPLAEDRKDLYLLYHYLNHYNLFGGGYYNTSARLLERLVERVS